jgi:hypothetical protein
VAAVERTGKKAPTEGAPDPFEKLLKGSCPNHAYPIKHQYKDYALMKWLLFGGSKRGIRRRSLTSWRTMPRRRGCLSRDDGLPHDLWQDNGL